MIRGATLSPCGRFRYNLTRSWEPSLFAPPLRIAWIMLNPSTADASIDDPTIRRVIDFSRREGACSLEVVNLFAYRATDPRDLRKASDPVGRENDAAILSATTGAARVICAWGVLGPLRDRGNDILALLRGRPLECLGFTADGSPRHPLYLRADAPFLPFRTDKGHAPCPTPTTSPT